MAPKEKSVVLEDQFFQTEAMFLYDYYTLQIIDTNEIAERKYGLTKDKILGKRITDLGEKYNPSKDSDNNSLIPANIWKHKNSKGEIFYVQFTVQQLKYKGKIVQLAIAHDISDKIDGLSTKLHELPRIDTMKSHIPLATIEWDENANIRDWSDAAQKIFGWSFNEIIGKNLFEIEILPAHLLGKAEENIRNFIDHQRSYFVINSEHVTKDNKKIFCTWHNAAIYDQSGKLLSIYSIVEDITEKKVAEEQLKESEHRFRVLSEASLVGVYMLQDSRFKYVNPRLVELSGYSKAEMINELSPFDLIHPSDRAKLEKLRKMWLSSEIDSFEVDVKIFNKQDKLIHIKVYGSKIFLGDKPAVIGVVVDQTKQVEATKKYKISVDSYRDLFDSIGDSIYILNKSGTLIEANKTALKTYGYSRNEIIGKDLNFLSAPGKVDLNKVDELFKNAKNGKQQRYEWWGRRKNGEIFPEEIHFNPGSYFGDEVVIAISRDISIQYEQQKELKENEQLFRQLFQNSPIGIALLDEHKEIQMANEGFEEIFGYSFEEIKGVSIDSVIAPDEKLDEARYLSESTEPFEVSSIRRKSDGTLIDVLIYGVPVVVEGKTIAIYGIYVDITDRKVAERQIRQSLKEKEVLLSEIHHRVKNNLAVITGLLELQSHRTTNTDASKALKDSQMRINSMALIHEKLYQNETLSRIDFDLYIRELTEVIRKSLSTAQHNIQVNFDTHNIQFSITQAIPCGLLLNEIVTNSFKHAFPADFNKTPELKIILHVVEEDKILLKIADNGIGLPGSFDDLGEKSLGLTLIKTITRQIKADFTVDTNKGTVYSFVFEKEDLIQST